MMFRRSVILALVLVIAGPAAIGGEDKLVLAIGFIPHVQFAPLYVGIEKGFYAQESVDLEIEYGFGIDIFSLLTYGRIHLGLSDSDQLILAAEKGLGLKAIFQYYQDYPVTIVAKRAMASTPSDLAGKTIGTPQLFGTSYIGLMLFLEHFGLTDKVEIEKIGYTQVSSLTADRVDAVVCFTNNEPIQLQIAREEIVRWDVRGFSRMAGASFITSADIIERDRDLLRRFVRATRRAIAYTVEYPGGALSLSEPYVGAIPEDRRAFTLEQIEATCELFASPGGYGYLDPETYADSIAALQRLGMIDGEVVAESILEVIE